MRLILLVACLVLAVQSAHAAGRLAEVLVIDRDSGVPLRTYYHRGEYRVAGNPGARYAIEIRNTLHERVLAVTSPPAANDFSWRISAAASVIVAGFATLLAWHLHAPTRAAQCPSPTRPGTGCSCVCSQQRDTELSVGRGGRIGKSRTRGSTPAQRSQH
jgi:hypothetical protein